mgnify:CR=1 FL=1
MLCAGRGLARVSDQGLRPCHGEPVQPSFPDCVSRSGEGFLLYSDELLGPETALAAQHHKYGTCVAHAFAGSLEGLNGLCAPAGARCPARLVGCDVRTFGSRTVCTRNIVYLTYGALLRIPLINARTPWACLS